MPTPLTARLEHVLRFPDLYTPREMASIARKEGLDIETPPPVVGETSQERGADLMRKKYAVLSKIAEFRRLRDARVIEFQQVHAKSKISR